MTDIIEIIGDLAAISGSTRRRAKTRPSPAQLLAGDWDKIGRDLDRVAQRVMKREKAST